MTRIESILITEVVVPAHRGSVNGADVDQPLHKLPVAGEEAWQRQFDELPKAIIELRLEYGTVGLGEFYRDHDWRILEHVANQLLGKDLENLNRSKLPIAHCREYDGFECAIWDAFAKLHHLRLVDLLGGPVQEKIKVGAWSGHRSLPEIAPLAVKFNELGYDCIKFKCDLLDDVVGWCQAISEHTDGMQVILDPNERWENAAEVQLRLDELQKIGNVLCLEDPIPRWMLTEYASLRSYSSVPIVLHVSLPYIYHGQRVHDAINALQRSAVDGFQL